MKKSKPEINARIHQLTNSPDTESELSTSEVTRSLFSDTWHNYLDQVQMAAVKINRSAIKAMGSDPDKDKLDKSRGSVRLFLQEP